MNKTIVFIGVISGCIPEQKVAKTAFFNYESPALTAELWARWLEWFRLNFKPFAQVLFWESKKSGQDISRTVSGRRFCHGQDSVVKFDQNGTDA